MKLILAHGEVVSHLFLVQRSEVRILVGQPYMNNLLDKIFFRSQNLNHINLGFKNIKKETEVSKIFEAIHSYSSNSEIRYVGGCVRKIINKEKYDDIDLAVNLNPKDVCEAHTNNDIMIEHVGSKTLFLGDNDLMQRFARFDGTSSMHGNITTLQYAIDLNLGHYVPGHGPSGDADSAVKPFLDYLIVIQEESKKGYEEDLADYEIKPFAHKRLADYHHWNGYEEQLGKHINKMLLEIESLDM